MNPVLREAVKHLAPHPLIMLRGPLRSRLRRQVALTFDDGPHELTTAYLDLLDERRVQSTFFLVGSECAKQGMMAEQIVHRGHEVANHSYSHRVFPELPRREILRELAATEEALPNRRIHGRPILRPPRGATSLRSLYVCAQAGYRTVLWSLDSGDARTRDAQVVVQRVSPGRVQPGDIVLMHEGQPWTLAALGPIVDGLLADGFELVTVRELLGT